MKRYIRTIESESSVPEVPEGNVGIWWFYNNTVEKYSCPIDKGYPKGGYIKFISQMKSDLPGVESGEVVYNIRSRVFEIICSEAIASDASAIAQIAKEFEISNQRYDIIPSSHYYVPTLTGNPTLDNFDFDT